MPEPTRRSLTAFFDSRLQPPYLRTIASAVLAVGLALAVLGYATADRGKTAFGPSLGADFAGFYVAAEILDRGRPQKLYDRELHAQLYHHLLPAVDRREIIPYVHPPFVAAALRPLTWLPYELAVLVWSVISLTLYYFGLRFLLRACPEINGRHRNLVLLLALAFEPFLFECWLGGQLSAVGFVSFALAYYFLQQRHPFAAGLALGVCCYKPTLLVLALPGLLCARQWRVVAGIATTGVLLGLLSLWAVGGETCRGYLDVLLAFRQNTSTGSGIEIRTWKYVDLSNNVRLLLGNTPWNLWFVAGLALGPFLWLLHAWSHWPRVTKARRSLLWAMTLLLTPVLNLYVGVYDSILVVQAALIVAELVVRRGQSLTASGWAYVLLLVFVTPWFSQNIAQAFGVQVYTWTLILMAMAAVRVTSRSP